MDIERIKFLIHELLEEIEPDIHREGLLKTPERVANLLKEILSGYTRDFKNEITVFENNYGYDDIVISLNIDFYSLCEHHLLPFWGYAHIGYIPNDKIIGLSKLARVVDIYSKRLQDQERMTVQIAEELMKILKPKGVAVFLEGKHLCNIMRGVRKKDSSMVTMCFRGILQNDPLLQKKFLDLVLNKKINI